MRHWTGQIRTAELVMGLSQRIILRRRDPMRGDRFHSSLQIFGPGGTFLQIQHLNTKM